MVAQRNKETDSGWARRRQAVADQGSDVSSAFQREKSAPTNRRKKWHTGAHEQIAQGHDAFPTGSPRRSVRKPDFQDGFPNDD